MPTTPEPTAAQELLRVGSVAMLLVGGVAVTSGLGLLKKRRSRAVVKPSPLHLALGIVLLVGGLIAMAFHRDPAPEPEVVTAQRFSSSGLPALSVDAPPPWQFEHDAEAGRLSGQRPGGRMMIETTFITDSHDAAGALSGVFGNLQRMGLRPAGDPFAQSFDGLQAAGRVGIAGDGSSALWVVERPGKLFTIIVCTSDADHDARTACDGVLSTLRWRPPGPR
jgi:hypothetical protein